jgi:hypothetical protein
VYLFKNLTEGDTLPQLVIDKQCIKDEVKDYHRKVPFSYLEQLPPAFLVGVMHKLKDLLAVMEDERQLRREDYAGRVIKAMEQS